MKYKALLLMFFITMNSSCQKKNDQFYFDFSDYEKIARDSLVIWYHNESWYFEKGNPVKGEYLGREVFALDELNIRSIPIIEFNKKIMTFKCGLKFMDLLDFKNSNPLNQLVLIYSNENIFVSINHIFPDDNEKQYIHYNKIEKIAPFGTGQVYLLNLILYDFDYPVFASPFGKITIIDNEIFFIKSENFTENSITYKLIQGDFYLNEVLGEEAVNTKIKTNRLAPIINRKPCNNNIDYLKEIIKVKKFGSDYFER